MADARVIFTGWGRSEWSSGTWSNPAVTLPSASGAVGTVTVSGDASGIAVSGIGVTTGVGSVSIEGAATIPATGLGVSGGVGSVTVVNEAIISPTGIRRHGFCRDIPCTT
jgi:hypothetical protein